LNDARAGLLATVRAALAGAPKPPLPPVPAWLGAAPAAIANSESHEARGPSDALVAHFCTRAQAIGAEIVLGPPPADPPPGTLVTATLAAIAASGSIVVEGAPRLPSALCEVHVAVVRRSTIVATLAEYLDAAARRPTPTARVIITGPSKTADIEGVLVTGVHGPRRLVIHLDSV
jgi:hypothetical protein